MAALGRRETELDDGKRAIAVVEVDMRAMRIRWIAR
jgi:hypothetical protein